MILNSILENTNKLLSVFVNISSTSHYFSVIYKMLWNFTPSVLQFTYTVSKDNSLIVFRPLILSDWHAIMYDFEKNVKSIFSPERGDIVIDVGANIGLYTLTASRHVGSNGLVISIEPDESNLVVLKKNVSLNGFNHVKIFPIALGSSTKTKNFFKGIMPTGSTFFPSTKRTLFKVRSVQKINPITLDSLLKKLQINDVDWIKIDVEHMDFDVLKGGEHFLKDSKKVKIILESSNNDTLKYLKSLGFKIKK